MIKMLAGILTFKIAKSALHFWIIIIHLSIKFTSIRLSSVSISAAVVFVLK